jgi:hypothetical protein
MRTMPENEDQSASPEAPAASKVAENASSAAKEDMSKRKEEPAAPVEVDEFGLPIRKARKPPPREIASEDEAEEEQFHDASEISTEQKKIDTNPASEKENQKAEQPKEQEQDEAKSAKAQSESTQVPDKPTEAQKDESAPTKDEDVLNRKRASTISNPRKSLYMNEGTDAANAAPKVSEWSHQQMAPQPEEEEVQKEDEWQTMPAYAPFDIYNDDGKLVAKEVEESDDEYQAYGNLGGAGKGYTRVQIDEDAQSATSMDDNTAYLFKEQGTDLLDDEEARDPLAQMQTTKNLLTEGQRIAYVGLVRLAMAEMVKEYEDLTKTKGTKKIIDLATESMKMWSQKMMVRLYSHMEIESAEQIMIEQLGQHGVQPSDLTPSLMQNARVKNPVADGPASSQNSLTSPKPTSHEDFEILSPLSSPRTGDKSPRTSVSSPPPYQSRESEDLPAVRTPSQLPNTANLDIDLRWTVLCDLFLVLIADSVYDARSRQLLERTGSFLDVPWIDICRFEKRVIDALEMQEAANKETWNEDEHMESRKKAARTKRLVYMGLATVGGGLVIGLSAGLLAPVIGAGLAAGFTTIGVTGTSAFLSSAGAAALITTTGVAAGGSIGVRAANRRTGAVKTFEYRPLHNNKRVNLIVSVSGWMTGKVDDVRLPFSTVDPLMGDIYSVFWEPEMLTSMGDTINILATEVSVHPSLFM